MRTLLLTCACLAFVSAPALACRGTAEYPEVALQLAQASIAAAAKDALTNRLDAGDVLHRRGHEIDSIELMKESLKILDEIKAQIAK